MGVKLGLSSVLREERILNLFENRVLKIILGPKRGEIKGE
jgi:hypothetical protein